MGRSRYKIYEPTYPHFITCTILHWIPIFTRTETTNIIFDSLKFLQKEDNLKIYAYVILKNHLHMIVSSDDVSKHWRYSSARDYEDIKGLIDVERLF